MRIYLVRHGQSLANVNKQILNTMPDHKVPLSGLGRNQAIKAGAFLQHHLNQNPIWSGLRIWTSPYERARETAEIIRKELGFHATIREHINLSEQQFGLFDGFTDEEIAEKFPLEWKRYNFYKNGESKFWHRMPGGESSFDVAVRIHEAFGTFHRDNEKHNIDTLVIVCHGIALRAFVMQWLHLTPEWYDKEPNPGNCWVRLMRDDHDRGYLYAPLENQKPDRSKDKA